MRKNTRTERGSTSFVTVFFISFYLLLPSTAQSGPADRGKQIFDAKCAACHTIGGGRKVGPDLQGVTKLHPQTWLFDFISNPEKMFASNDSNAITLLNEFRIRMPNMGLSPDDVNAVISYLEAQAGGAPQTTAAPPAKTTTTGQAALADSEKGEQYFTGRLAFQNGGPPCMACHSVPGIKFLGGGNLGPDLTTAYQSLGGGIVSLLVNVPFPTMKPIFDKHPLTSTEAGDIAAFLQRVSSERPQNYAARIVSDSAVAFAILMLVILLVWRNRLTSVRKTMVEHARREDQER
jgi:mono/diheme cytochrome c family protein